MLFGIQRRCQETNSLNFLLTSMCDYGAANSSASLKKKLIELIKQAPPDDYTDELETIKESIPLSEGQFRSIEYRINQLHDQHSTSLLEKYTDYFEETTNQNDLLTKANTLIELFDFYHKLHITSGAKINSMLDDAGINLSSEDPEVIAAELIILHHSLTSSAQLNRLDIGVGRLYQQINHFYTLKNKLNDITSTPTAENQRRSSMITDAEALTCPNTKITAEEASMFSQLTNSEHFNQDTGEFDFTKSKVESFLIDASNARGYSANEVQTAHLKQYLLALSVYKPILYENMNAEQKMNTKTKIQGWDKGSTTTIDSLTAIMLTQRNSQGKLGHTWHAAKILGENYYIGCLKRSLPSFGH